MSDTQLRFPSLGRDWKVYVITSVAYCLSAISILQGRSFWPVLSFTEESGFTRIVFLIVVYSILDGIIILAGRWCNPVFILMLEWGAFTTVLPPVCSFLQDGIYLQGNCLLFSRFLAIFSASLLAEKMSVLGKLRKPTLAKQYYILAFRILVPIIVVSAFIESLI